MVSYQLSLSLVLYQLEVRHCECRFTPDVSDLPRLTGDPTSLLSSHFNCLPLYVALTYRALIPAQAPLDFMGKLVGRTAACERNILINNNYMRCVAHITAVDRCVTKLMFSCNMSM